VTSITRPSFLDQQRFHLFDEGIGGNRFSWKSSTGTTDSSAPKSMPVTLPTLVSIRIGAANRFYANPGHDEPIVRLVHHDIEHDQVGLEFLDRRHALFPTGGRRDLMPFLFEHHAYHFQDVGIVVND
jgi:hypothetical protein